MRNSIIKAETAAIKAVYVWNCCFISV